MVELIKFYVFSYGDKSAEINDMYTDINLKLHILKSKSITRGHIIKQRSRYKRWDTLYWKPLYNLSCYSDRFIRDNGHVKYVGLNILVCIYRMVVMRQ